MAISESYIARVLSGRGGGELGRYPDRMQVGWFPFSVDLGTALTATTQVADLTAVASRLSAKLRQLGFTGDRPDLSLYVSHACLVLGGAEADALDPGDLAELQASLNLQLVANENTQYQELGWLAVASPRVATQRTQGTAADGSFGATAPAQAHRVHPVMRANLRQDTFGLWSENAVATYAGSADLDESVLWLYGAAVQNTVLAEENAWCGRMMDPGRGQR